MFLNTSTKWFIVSRTLSSYSRGKKRLKLLFVNNLLSIFLYAMMYAMTTASIQIQNCYKCTHNYLYNFLICVNLLEKGVIYLCIICHKERRCAISPFKMIRKQFNPCIITKKYNFPLGHHHLCDYIIFL